MGMINVAIIGVGNCASSLVQGVYYYKNAKENEFVPGLMHVNLGGYHVADINFVAAFDIDKNKVGKDLAKAIYTPPNNTIKFCDVPKTGVRVERGMTHDGLGKYLSQIITKAPGPTADIVGILKETKTDVVLNYLPLFRDRGVKLERTYQLNFGGNTDFLNMLERERLESKKISKTNAVTSQLDYDIGPDNIHVGPSDYVSWLTDRKFCYIKMEGRTFGDVPLNLELKMEVWDSPNSAGVVIDALRCCKLALDRGLSGAIVAPSAYFMKSPPIQYSDDEARLKTEAFITGQEQEEPVSLSEPQPVEIKA